MFPVWYLSDVGRQMYKGHYLAYRQSVINTASQIAFLLPLPAVQIIFPFNSIQY
jgi:hypothetical protein